MQKKRNMRGNPGSLDDEPGCSRDPAHPHGFDRNGLGEQQVYEYTPNPNGHRRIFRKMKNGQWAEHFVNPETKRLVKTSSCGLRLGHREKYEDPSF